MPDRFINTLPADQGRQEKLPAIAVFDIGKTNKKVFVFGEDYSILFEQSVRITETVDEDGDPSEDVAALTQWVREVYREISRLDGIAIRAINFSAYGASFVHLDQSGAPVTPLYNYLKPFPADLRQEFYARYGGEDNFSLVTASPALGHLNSGLQLYWLKKTRPAVFQQVACSLHLPQYLSYLFSGKAVSDLTSVGCHTGLWNFNEQHYHHWIYEEDIAGRLAPLAPPGETVAATVNGQPLLCGIGLHDSSAALVPYLSGFTEPFILLSSGTWCISLNPFNHQPLTLPDLHADCLCYLSYQGNPVRASRLFSGQEHEQQVQRIADHFNLDAAFAHHMSFDPHIAGWLKKNDPVPAGTTIPAGKSVFPLRELAIYPDAITAYHRLVIDLANLQAGALALVTAKPVSNLYVDGGFAGNAVYMNLLADALPGMHVAAASVSQASAIGAALAIHTAWNRGSVPTGLIQLKPYRLTESVPL